MFIYACLSRLTANVANIVGYQFESYLCIFMNAYHFLPMSPIFKPRNLIQYFYLFVNIAPAPTQAFGQPGNSSFALLLCSFLCVSYHLFPVFLSLLCVFHIQPLQLAGCSGLIQHQVRCLISQLYLIIVRLETIFLTYNNIELLNSAPATGGLFGAAPAAAPGGLFGAGKSFAISIHTNLSYCLGSHSKK